MYDFVFVFQAFVTLFLIVDPVGNIPVFLGLMGGFDDKYRVRMVSRSVFIACTVLMFFTLFGNAVFMFLGFSMYSFRVAGGLLLLIISVEMLFGNKTRTEMSDDIKAGGEDDLAVSPMAVPLLTGPGAISSGIVLFNSAPTYVDKVLVCFTIPVVFLVSYLILLNSNRVYKMLGKTGTKVVVRLMGLMLSAIALQFIILGLREAFPGLSGG